MSATQPLALIVEDRPEISKMWQKCLEPLELSVIHASNLTEAYNQLKRIPPPDLVLLDLNLTETETAIHTVNQIAHIKTFNPDMVVIVISGVITQELATIAIQQGAHGVREKMDMANQVDLWRTIESSLQKAPQSTKNIFQHTQTLLDKMSKAMHLM